MGHLAFSFGCVGHPAGIFRGVRRSAIEVIALGTGICWTLGWTTLFIGHLNILSVVFAPLLCGLGVDYGIHWFARYEEEERHVGLDRKSLLRRVAEISARGFCWRASARPFPSCLWS